MIQPTKDCSHRVQSKPIILYYTILALQSSIKVDNAHAPSPSVSIDTVRLQDIYILGGTMIFYSILQMFGQYFYEFHVDNLQIQNGLAGPVNCLELLLLLGVCQFSTVLFHSFTLPTFQ